MAESASRDVAPPTPTQVPRAALVWGALLWVVLACIEVSLGAALPNGVLRHGILPFWARVAALASNLFVLSLLTALGVLVAIALHHLLAPLRAPLRARFESSSPSFQRLLWALAYLLLIPCVAMPVGLYVVSWASYRQLGAFPNHEAVQFLGLSGPQIAQHLAQQSPVLAVVVPVSIALFCGLLAFGAPRLVRRIGPVARARLVRVAGAGTALVFLLSVTGHVVTASSSQRLPDPTSGSTVPLRQAFAFERAHSAGAFSAALFNTWAPLVPREEERPRRTDMKIARRPIIPMSEYVKRAHEKDFKRYNVIILLIDSMRRDELTELGAPAVVTPHIEEIAKTGRIFSDAYTSATHSDYTDPCPLTSQYPIRAPFGIEPYSKNPSYPRVFIYDVLHALGYRTAIISSQNETWGNMLEFLDNGTFDFILHSETFKGPTYVPRHDDTLRQFVNTTKRAGKIDDRFTVNEAIQWIGDGKNPKPFFIYMNLQSSHVPYEIPADFKRRFAPDGAEFSFTFAELAPDQVPLARAFYRDALAYSDEQIGRLVQHLKDIGQWENTIFVATGDTGQAFMEHNYFTHGRDIWQEVVRPSFVLHGPGVPPGIDDQLARQIDIPPTVLGLLGLPNHPSFAGIDLLNPPEGPRSAYLVVQTPLARQYGIVRGNYKLIKDVARKRVLLYDLSKDPGERHDLSRENPALVDDLESRLDTYYAETISYFTDKERQKREYPPVFED